MSTVVIAVDQDRLDELAQIINTDNVRVGGLLAKALDHAITVGEALLEAHSLLPRGTWTHWYKANVDMSPASVQMYMRIAENQDAIKMHAITSIAAANQFVVDNKLRRQVNPEKKAEILRLRAEGLSEAKIGQKLGLAQTTVHNHLNDPEMGFRPRPLTNLSGHRRYTGGVTDPMIEVAAEWLVKRFGDAGYFATVNDQVRHDATELLALALRASGA